MTSASRHAAQALTLVLVLGGFWIACVSTVRVDEMLVGIPATVLSVVWCLSVVRKLPLQFRPSLRDLVQIWRMPWYIISGLTEIALVLAKDFAGRTAPSLFRSAPWGPTFDNGYDTANRVLAIAYTTVAPNFVIIGIDCERGQMLFHQVQKSGVPLMTQHLGAGDGQ